MRKPSSRLRAFLIAGAILLLPSLLVTQTGSKKLGLKQRSPSDSQVFKKSVRRVLVDIVVEDATGKPVSGLTSKDLTLLEDGKPQHILTFDVHDFETSAVSIPANSPLLPPNTFVDVPDTPERGPLIRNPLRSGQHFDGRSNGRPPATA